MSDRLPQTTQFVTNCGWDPDTMVMVAGDASPRKYYRVRKGTHSAIIMDADPAQGQDTSAFVHIARHLSRAGLSAPEIFHEEPVQGFLLVEDFGDGIVADLINEAALDEDQIYRRAMDVLVQLHSVEIPQLEPMFPNVMADMVMVCLDWYRLGAVGDTAEALKTVLTDTLSQKFAILQAMPQVLALRDYHAENLIWLPDRIGVRQLGLLDFQDLSLIHI